MYCFKPPCADCCCWWWLGGFAGLRCTLWDPDTAENEVLCPWVLPYSDGRFIIIDLVDMAPPGTTTPAPSTAAAAAVADAADAAKAAADAAAGD